MFCLILSYSGIIYCNDKIDITALKYWSNNSDLILVGKVLKVGPPPLRWSGYILASQKVKYQKLEVLQGEYLEEQIEVYHDINMASKDVDLEKVCLLENIFKEGNILILFLEFDKDYDRYFPSDGSLIATPENIDLVNSIIAAESNPEKDIIRP